MELHNRTALGEGRGDVMEFEFQYRITYESGQAYDRPHRLNVPVTKEEYNKIMLGILDGKSIREIEGIDEVIAKMTEQVQFVDRWYNLNGTQRKTPLKKPRDISDLDFFLPQSEYMRIKKMKNPKEVMERPEEHMTIYRSDGSSVTISSENGKVKVTDSRKNNMGSIREADHFISLIS